jgi:hypothetical protein
MLIGISEGSDETVFCSAIAEAKDLRAGRCAFSSGGVTFFLVSEFAFVSGGGSSAACSAVPRNLLRVLADAWCHARMFGATLRVELTETSGASDFLLALF